jgi:hypothetical protein
MSKELGDGWTSGPQLTRTVESDGTALDVGDAVSIDASEQVGATGDTDTVYGVVAGPADDRTDMDNLSAGDLLSVVVHGDVIANAASGVSHGDRVTPNATAGQLGTDSAGSITAYSDAGGTIDGGSLGANEAAVFVEG